MVLADHSDRVPLRKGLHGAVLIDQIPDSRYFEDSASLQSSHLADQPTRDESWLAGLQPHRECFENLDYQISAGDSMNRQISCSDVCEDGKATVAFRAQAFCAEAYLVCVVLVQFRDIWWR